MIKTMKHSSPSPRRLLTFLLVGVALSLGACDNSNSTKAPGTKDSEQAKADAKEPAAEGDAEACKKYNEKFCEVVGEKSPSCQAMGSVSSLMPPKACQAGLDDLDFTKKQVAEMGKKCTELMDKLCADLGEDTQTCAMVRERTPQFPPEQCQAMMGQYDKVLGELKAQEAMNKPLSAELAKKIATGAPAFGPEDAAVTIVEFSDFQCPYCTMAAKTVDEIKKNYDGKVRVVFRQFPLSFHKEAHLAAQAALAAHEQGKFWAYHDKLFANQKALTRPDLEKYAKELKLDMGKFKKALDAGTYKATVDGDLALGKEVVVQGTPTMFLNGERVPNPTSFQAIKPMIDKALSAKK